MKSFGYDMFNINDPFYQYICTKYATENNTDIPLSARKNIFIIMKIHNANLIANFHHIFRILYI